ncbi:MAG: hypothetical protein WD294_16725 [Phycisphaeraceae bacterium]
MSVQAEPSPSHRRIPRAFTLVEMLIGLALSSMVGLGVAMMLAAVGSGTQTQQHSRESMVTRQVVIHRLGEVTRDAASMVLTDHPHHIVLWIADANGNRVPDTSELRRIEWDKQSQEIWVYEAVDDLAVDRSYNLNQSYTGATNAEINIGNMPGRLLLSCVTDWEVDFDEADVKAARLLRVRVTFERAGGEETVTVISALRHSVDVQ